MNVKPYYQLLLVLLPLRPVQAYAQSRSCNAKVPPTGIRWHPVVRYHIFRTVHTNVGAGSVDSFVLSGDDVRQQLTLVIMSSTSCEWSALHDYVACGTDRRFWLDTVFVIFFSLFWWVLIARSGHHERQLRVPFGFRVLCKFHLKFLGFLGLYHRVGMFTATFRYLDFSM